MIFSLLTSTEIHFIIHVQVSLSVETEIELEPRPTSKVKVSFWLAFIPLEKNHWIYKSHTIARVPNTCIEWNA